MQWMQTKVDAYVINVLHAQLLPSANDKSPNPKKKIIE